MNLNSPFYYPVVLHDNANVVTLLAPVVETLPVTPDVPVVILPEDLGNRVQGLYAYKGRCWYLVLPMHEVSRSIIRGDVLDIYANLTAPMEVPTGTFVWANGGAYPGLELVPGAVMYLIQTPPSTSGGGSVSSVNGQTGIVSITAANLPGLAPVSRSGSYTDLVNAPVLANVATSGSYNDLTNTPAPFVLGAATASIVGGVSVPVSGNLTVTAQGAISLSTVVTDTINNKIGSVQNTGIGTGLVQSTTAGSVLLKSLTGTGTVTIADDGAGNITLNGAAASYTLPTASAALLGGVRVGAGLAIDGSGILSLNAPIATAAALGAVRVGTGLTIDPVTGVLSSAAVQYVLPAATTTTLGGVSVGSGLSVTAQGALSATPYSLPAATSGALGGVRVGTGLTIDGSGVLSVTGGAYTLPTASDTILGGVRVGSNLSIDGAGVLSAAMYTLPAATTSVRGGVSVGTGLAVTAQGLLSAAVASASTLGAVRVGAGLLIDGAGILSATGGDYTLPAATDTILGGIKVGANLSATADGTLSAPAPYQLPVATTTVVGGVSVGSGLAVNAQGVLSATGGEEYVLPAATTSILGGVIAGSGLDVTAGGVLSVTPVAPTIATDEVLGSVRVGNGLSIDGSGILSATGGEAYTLPVATTTVLGGVKAGANLTVAGDGTLSAAAPYSLPTASATVVGGVRVGAGLAIDGAGILSSTGGGVASFNTRTGAVTLASTDVTAALTYTPVNKAGDTLTGALNQAAPVDVTAAALTNLGAVNSNNIVISGTTPITSLGNLGFSGVVRRVTFAGGNTIVHNPSTLALPGNANITTVYGDVAEFLSFGDGSNWRCVSYTRSDGTALVASAGGVASFNTRTGAVTLATADVTTALGYTPVNKAGDTLTGALNEAPPIQVPSAATVDLTTVASNNVAISGTTTITGFGVGPIGNLRRVVFTGALTLTHNSAGIVLPGAANILTANGDVAEFLSLGASVWKCTSYQRADGTALVASAGAAYTAGTGLTLTGNAFSITPSGVSAGSYTKVTVDATGRITVGAQLAALDITNGLGYTPVNRAGDTLTGALNEAAIVPIVAAATTAIGGVNSTNVRITGSTTITSFGTFPAGAVRRVQFFDTPILTHGGGTIILPGSANILVESEDWAEFVSLGGGAWVCVSYTRKSGKALVGGGASPFSTTQVFNGSTTEVALKMKNAVEQISISATAPTGVIPRYVSDGAVLFTTAAAAAAWTLNVRQSAATTLNSVLAVGDAITVTHLATQGATPYLLTAVQVDGVAQTIRWQSAVPISGTPSGIDCYVITVVKTAEATFTVLVTMAPYL